MIAWWNYFKFWRKKHFCFINIFISKLLTHNSLHCFCLHISVMNFPIWIKTKYYLSLLSFKTGISVCLVSIFSSADLSLKSDLSRSILLPTPFDCLCVLFWSRLIEFKLLKTFSQVLFRTQTGSWIFAEKGLETFIRHFELPSLQLNPLSVRFKQLTSDWCNSKYESEFFGMVVSPEILIALFLDGVLAMLALLEAEVFPVSFVSTSIV